MNTDKQLALCESQAFSANANSTNVIDLSVAGRRIGAGAPFAVVIAVEVAADGTSANETYQFEIITDDNAALASPTTLVTKVISRTVLLAGTKHLILIEPDTDFERYLAIHFTGGGTTPTITVSAWVEPEEGVASWKAYPTAGGFA